MRSSLALFLLVISSYIEAGDFSLTSPQIKDGDSLTNEQVFNGFGCSGENISPELHWQNPPKGTKSFALTVYDPDAPTGSGWWHWTLFNIPAEVTHLPRNAGNPSAGLAPKETTQGRTDYGQPGFGGACPPVGHGPHRYYFTLYALKVDKLDVDANASAALLGFMLNANKLATTRLTATYERKK